MPETDIRGVHERRRGRGRNIDGRSGAADLDRLRHRGFDHQRHADRVLERGDVNRPAHDPVRQNDDEHEGGAAQRPFESAVRSGPTDPRWPTIVTSAFAIGSRLRASMTCPTNARAGAAFEPRTVITITTRLNMD